MLQWVRNTADFDLYGFGSDTSDFLIQKQGCCANKTDFKCKNRQMLQWVRTTLDFLDLYGFGSDTIDFLVKEKTGKCYSERERQ